MTWITDTREDSFLFSETKSGRWFVYHREANRGPTPNSPVFGPLSSEQASRLALLLNDLQIRHGTAGEPSDAAVMAALTQWPQRAPYDYTMVMRSMLRAAYAVDYLVERAPPHEEP